jgi:hypothetical protein
MLILDDTNELAQLRIGNRFLGGWILKGEAERKASR